MSGYNSTAVKCVHCGEVISSNEKYCPFCKQKQARKKPILKITLIALACLIVLIIFASLPTPSSQSTPNSAAGVPQKTTSIPQPAPMTKEEYMASCSSVVYEDVARNPGKYEGKAVTFTGKVIQVIEGTPATYRIAQDNPNDKFAIDAWLVGYTAPKDAPRILEDDRITVYGECLGVETYTSIFGQEITVPTLAMKCYDAEDVS